MLRVNMIFHLREMMMTTNGTDLCRENSCIPKNLTMVAIMKSLCKTKKLLLLLPRQHLQLLHLLPLLLLVDLQLLKRARALQVLMIVNLPAQLAPVLHQTVLVAQARAHQVRPPPQQQTDATGWMRTTWCLKSPRSPSNLPMSGD